MSGIESNFPLHEACREGKVDVAESLLNANPKLATQVDNDDRLPIHWAASYNQIPIISLLMNSRSFDPDVQDSSGWTPLMIASSLKEGNGEALLDLLLSKEADVNVRTNGGQTALFFACSKNSLQVARKLISHKASTRVRDKRGQLPLMRAAAIGSVPIVQLLLSNKSPLNASDMDGLTALHHAIGEGHGVVAVELLKAGAEIDKRDADGRLAIDLAPDTKIRSYISHEAEREGIEL
ncbi:MAG: hypothetical protein Q9160_002629 [Pyrenula sp. 1 TL-2023]